MRRLLRDNTPTLGLLLALLLALLAGRAQAADSAEVPHLRVTLLAEQAAVVPGSDQRLALRFVLERGWHIYWSNPGDSGTAPTVTWTLPAGLRAGALQWPTPQRLVTGPLVNYGYAGDAVLLVPLRAAPDLAGDAVTLRAAVRWLVCSEPCIPGQAELTLTLTVRRGPLPVEAGRAALFTAAQAALPVDAPEGLRLRGSMDRGAFQIEAEQGPLAAVRGASFLPLDADQIDNAAPQGFTASPRGFALRLPRSEQLLKDPPHLRGLLLLDLAGAAGPARSLSVTVPLLAPPPPAAAPAPPRAPMSLLLSLALALLGGALLNLMPCVFPVLCLKALGLVELAGADRARARGHGLAYAAGTVLSFWVLAGALIALRYTGQQIGWGFQLQSPRFLLALSAVIFLLGLNLLGVFELGLGLTRAGQVVAGRSGYLGALGTGVLATVVATPCTAPFMGTAVGFALTQPALPALLIFTALGVGLALPYLLLLFVPGLRRALPRPGAWMETFKQAMGFLLFCTVLWLAWVLAIGAGAEAVVALLSGLLLVGFAGWLLHRWPERRLVAGLAWLLFAAAALAPGLVLPGGARAAQGSQSAAGTGAADDLPWERFSPELLASHRRAGRRVLVDFTAAWCVSCKVNELVVLRSQAVRARIRELGVATLKADWTRYDPMITQALAEHGRSGVPFYLLYGRDPQVPAIQLPEVLSTNLVLNALNQLK